MSERRISIDEMLSASKEGRLEEFFGTGTAAVISPVDKIVFNRINSKMLI